MDNFTHQNQFKSKKINYSMNVIKCLAIFAVICLHCQIYKLGNFGLAVDGVSRFAVPFFFLISGFYSFYLDDNYSIKKYKTRIIRLLKLIVIANAVYMIYFLITMPNYDIVAIFNINSCINYLLYNISPTAGALWFLQALLYCYILFLVLKILNINVNKLYYLIPILLIINIILGEFSTFTGLTINKVYYRNFLFMGLPFFTLGYMIHDKENKINKIFSNKITILLVIVTLIIAIVEVLLYQNIQDLFLGTILFTTALFIYCVNNPDTLNFKITGWIGSNLYVSMYVLHTLIILIITPYLNFNYFYPIIIFAITAIISTVIYLITSNFDS